MERNFFQLEGSPIDIEDQESFYALIPDNAHLKDRIYRPKRLCSSARPFRWQVTGVKFENVSLSQTLIDGFEFKQCTFTKCLFLGTVFRNCWFDRCEFIDSNTFRAEFQSSYLDPSSFIKCLDPKQHSNIGVSLFQEILRNSREQAQPDYADEAQYQFRRWRRFLLISETRNRNWITPKLGLIVRIILYYIFEKTAGYGMRISNLIISSIISIFFIAVINFVFSNYFGLQNEGHPLSTAHDAFYFSTITITTLGFGDFTPTTAAGRVLIGMEAIFGLVLFALLTSTIYRRISP